MHLLRLKRGAQTRDERPAKFDLLRRREVYREQPGGAFPAALVSELCMQNASLLRADKSLGSGSVDGNLGLAGMAQQTLRVFRPVGGSGRRDAPEEESVSLKGGGLCWLGCVPLSQEEIQGGGKGDGEGAENRVGRRREGGSERRQHQDGPTESPLFA